MAADAQSAQLEAFRRLFANNELLAGLLAQGLGDTGIPKQSRSKNPVKLQHMQDLVVRELKRRRLLRKEYQSRNPEVVKGKTVNRVINNSFRSDEEDDAAQPESASSSRYTPRERIQVSRPQYHNTDFGLMDDDDGRAPKQFVVGLDYGTTFASVSYYAYPESEDNPRALPSDVKIIVNWPADGMSGKRRQIPTESWYSTIPKVRVPSPDQFELGESADENEDIEQTTRSSTGTGA
ncbi:hypothetical protein IFR04_006121 [Cadophora malorum]|uniref:Uncharacterized protein n=1 Tax=Cadophora malorum TaxID=108018 RepID=A0A8H7TFL3_9HELO|nr:hypothetical protein IFR04_006121 [Cadophora malorum]